MIHELEVCMHTCILWHDLIYCLMDAIGEQGGGRKVSRQPLPQADGVFREAVPSQRQERTCLSLLWGERQRSKVIDCPYVSLLWQEFDERGRKEPIPAGIYDLVCTGVHVKCCAWDDKLCGFINIVVACMLFWMKHWNSPRQLFHTRLQSITDNINFPIM